MTGATSTTGGGGGAAARTFPLLQPSAFSSSTALTKVVDICFIISFPSIVVTYFRFNRVTGAPESGRCSVGGKCGPRVVLSIQARQSRDCTLLQKQIAYQNRHEAKSRQIKELSKQFSTKNVEGVESVEKAGARPRNS